MNVVENQFKQGEIVILLRNSRDLYVYLYNIIIYVVSVSAYLISYLFMILSNSVITGNKKISCVKLIPGSL